MAPSRAMAAVSISKIFEEAASAACRKTGYPSIATRRFLCSTVAARLSSTRQKTPSSYCKFQRSAISTATEPVTDRESSSLPDPLGAPRVHSATRDNTASNSQQATEKNQHPLIVGRVTKAGLNPTIVQVTRNIQKYNKPLQKHFRFDDRYLVYDPMNSLRDGDVVDFHRMSDEEYRARIAAGKGKLVKHVVNSILSPFAVPIEQRPKVIKSERERMKSYWKPQVQEKRAENDVEDVVEGTVKQAKNKNQQVVADRLEAAQEVQEILNEEGITEEVVEKRAKQARV